MNQKLSFRGRRRSSRTVHFATEVTSKFDRTNSRPSRARRLATSRDARKISIVYLEKLAEKKKTKP